MIGAMIDMLVRLALHILARNHATGMWLVVNGEVFELAYVQWTGANGTMTLMEGEVKA